MEKIKFIKNQLNVTFSSVLLSAISSGIESSLQDLKNKRNIGKDEGSKYCIGTLPLPGHPKTLTNHSTTTHFDLPIAKYDNPVEKLI